MKLGVIDYGRGNLRSVLNACQSVGYEPIVVTKAEEFADLTHLIFPGQGAFGDTMEGLARLGLVEALRNWILADKPYFGICVGYQLLFASSEESPGVAGLGIFDAKVRRFTSTEVKIPHMGWNSVKLQQTGSPYFRGLDDEAFFYFVHSYHPTSVSPEVNLAECDYGEVVFPAAVARGNLLATQFHPEKSQHAGLQLLQNFLEKEIQ